ncbi:hypothetical protein PAXRUDRAFT_43961, partial [Paxillus rubicundulus Ve08.2h10]
LSFSVICSTTILLTAWWGACIDSCLKPNLLPHDVTTRWNSTYNMLVLAFKYQVPIGCITSNKKL